MWMYEWNTSTKNVIFFFFKKNNGFSIIQVFRQATTQIVHFNPMAFPISEQWSAQSYLQPPFCLWNHVKSAAIGMLGAKQQRKIQQNVFADVQKLLEDKFQGVSLKLTLSISIFSNPTDLASMVCNIQIFQPCGMVITDSITMSPSDTIALCISSTNLRQYWSKFKGFSGKNYLNFQEVDLIPHYCQTASAISVAFVTNDRNCNFSNSRHWKM